MEGPNSDPFLDRHRSSHRRRPNTIFTHVFMLFLPYHAHQQEQPKYQDPHPGSFQYDIDTTRGEPPYLVDRAARI
jgi:hypothetical protein